MWEDEATCPKCGAYETEVRVIYEHVYNYTEKRRRTGPDNHLNQLSAEVAICQKCEHRWLPETHKERTARQEREALEMIESWRKDKEETEEEENEDENVNILHKTDCPI